MAEIVKKKSEQQRLAGWHPLRAIVPKLAGAQAKKIAISTGPNA